MKLEEHSLQNEKKEANYEKILFRLVLLAVFEAVAVVLWLTREQFVLSV